MKAVLLIGSQSGFLEGERSGWGGGGGDPVGFPRVKKVKNLSYRRYGKKSNLNFPYLTYLGFLEAPLTHPPRRFPVSSAAMETN